MYVQEDSGIELKVAFFAEHEQHNRVAAVGSFQQDLKWRNQKKTEIWETLPLAKLEIKLYHIL